TPPVPLDVTEAVAGGYSLADHLRDGTAARLIDEGRWDWVVLQEQSLQPTMASGRFMASLRRLDERIRAVHARTALFALPPRLDWHQDTQVVQRAYISAAAEVGATLVPVGAAWSSALAERPRLDLYQADGYHPRPAGTYLGACVFYATLTGKSPEGLPPRAGSIALAPDLALELQHAARLAAGK
ncbi:MAG TPA: hypothetical protein VLM85_10185, partial [Polyangiaceae bacterium]|nr:hypothetical protein [Polyangiaceae bacterium]